MLDAKTQAIREKAKAKRYKKPIHREINLDSIRDTLYDISSECSDVEWFFEGGDETLLDELIGGEDEAREFKFMFTQLEVECTQMLEDLENEWVPEFFDVFFAASSSIKENLIGWDDYEEDYMGLSCDYEREIAIREARSKVKRYTKDQILEASQQCFLIVMNYLALRNRYEDLKASMDIIRSQNKAELDVLKNINALYMRADKESDGFRLKYIGAVLDFDKFVSSIDPYSQMWIG